MFSLGFSSLTSSDGNIKLLLLNTVILSPPSLPPSPSVSSGGRPAAAARRLSDSRTHSKLEISEAGESWSSRASRFTQFGFTDANKCPQLAKLAFEYLKKTHGCEDDIFAFISHEDEAEFLYVKLIQELDRCILGYFAFHWDHATLLITRILAADKNDKPKRKLKDLVLEATRKQRFERLTRDLKVARVFSTLVEEMKAIGLASHEESPTNSVMVPAAHADRSPVLLLMGGGMGAGKSTVLKDLLKDAFWLEASANAVVVEADAFKETDIIYRALSSMGHHNDMLQTAELVCITISIFIPLVLLFSNTN
ncbi:uncharacterized protein LOC109847800 [Asparagus officinalis]|uniref:uncharacterized protein LOC109847800 n=1 Tax=Asparagus officinalis TaxID=4686 RepID=UPI00098E1D2E|nr:uncharacterized protein LOC109847800 [Asparagus officinalis]